jgi:thiol-disulfide isomerase/thioredoxin
MKYLHLLAGCLLVAIALVACHSSSFKINGTIEGVKDGDILYISYDLEQGTPADSFYVKDGKFTYEGKTDSTRLCVIYSKTRIDINSTFFVEPGEIDIQLSDVPERQKVSGTKVNEQWQLLVDSINLYSKQLNDISAQLFSQAYNEEAQAALRVKATNTEAKLSQCILAFADRNITNELGFFLVNLYDENYISDSNRLKLIDKMTVRMQKRPQIQQMKRVLISRSNTALSDFSMRDVNGNMVSVLDEIKKNKITVIDFWASWCGPCIHEMPDMIKMYNQYKPMGLGIIGVSLDSNEKAWKSAITSLSLPWTHISELNGWNNSMINTYGIRSIPYTMIVSKDGKILQKGLRGQQLADAVGEYLSEK